MQPNEWGARHGRGARVRPVGAEADEPVFHAEWERRVLALTLAMGATGEWNLDATRFARENWPPGTYLARSYYEIWLAGLETQLSQGGLVTPEEVAAGRSLTATPAPVKRVLAARDVVRTLREGSPTNREPSHPPRFAPGARVRAKTSHPHTHTRLPRYVRGRIGTVQVVHGCHVYPDAHAHGRGEDPQWLYTVRFDARELWGAHGDPTSAVSVDAFEPYLEPVT